MSDGTGVDAKGPAAQPTRSAPAARLDDAIYQRDELVARVDNAEIDLDAKEIRFAEIHNSDWLVLADECEFQRYRIMVQKIAFAAREDKAALHKGRVLRGVTAEILGCREQ